jgi:hypothetical protein
MQVGSTNIPFWQANPPKEATPQPQVPASTPLPDQFLDEWIGLAKGHSEAYRTYLENELTSHFPTNILVPGNLVC